MHIKETATKSVIRLLDGSVIEKYSTVSEELVLDEGEDTSNFTEEQKDAVLKRAFLGGGGTPLPPMAPDPAYAPEEYAQISKDIGNQYPKGAVPVMEGTMHVASDKLDGPPTEAPHESRVEKTTVSSAYDDIPPALRKSGV